MWMHSRWLVFSLPQADKWHLVCILFFELFFPHHSVPVFKMPFFTTKNFGLVLIQKFWW
jgi:hypothetical protein